MDDSKTVWCGNLADQVTEELLYELFLQVAPLERVKIPTDREGRRSNFGFITFKHEISVPYAVQLLNGTKMFDKSLNVRPRKAGSQQDKQNAQHNPIQRSVSYPNDMNNQFQQNQHTRFAEPAALDPQYIRYDMPMNVNYDYPEENYGNPYGDNHGHQHTPGNNHGNFGQYGGRNNRDRDKGRDRKDYDREWSRNDRERERKDDYSNNSRHNRRNNDRSGGRRHYRRF